jgi:pyruvate formate-lyase activating enzyme-like uncharacterized protein
MVNTLLVWLGFKKAHKVGFGKRVLSAQKKSSKLLNGFSKMKDELGKVNIKLATIVDSTEQEALDVLATAQAKADELRLHQAVARKEMGINNKVSIRLNDFLR